MRRCTTAAALAAGVAALAGSGGAQAAFYGANGKLAFSSNKSGQIEIIVANPDGTGRVPLGAPGSGPRWSADGRRIAFGSNRDGNNEIYVMNADGSGQTRLTNNTVYDSRPQWTASGRQLVFTRLVDGNWEIFRMDADGSNQVDITNSPAVEWGQATSPFGNFVVFTREDNGVGHLYLMTTSGLGPLRITRSSGYDSYPNWSPRGDAILFQRDSGTTSSNADLWVVRIGTGETQLTHTGGTAAILNGSWSPDGRKIVYTQCAQGYANPCALHVMNADGTGDVEISTPRVPFLDAFDGTRLDPFWGIPFVGGPGSSLAVANGRLEVSVPSTAQFDPSRGFISLGLAGTCNVRGDYDVQVDYNLLQWPPTPGVNVDFDTFDLVNGSYGDVHGMFVSDPDFGTRVTTHFAGAPFTFVNAPEASGTLRLTRVGSTITAYRLVAGSWTALQSTGDPGAPETSLNLSVFSNVLTRPDVKVGYDNFRVNAGTLACPTWWNDSNPDWQPLSR